MDWNPFHDLYCELMEEIKQRMAAITTVVNAQVPLPRIIAFELRYLQLRMICELIALGCLAAHGEVAGTKELQKKYHAGTIVDRLAKLHPDFYPVPTRQMVNPKTGKVERTESIQQPYLTKQDLGDLYVDCGSVLHRGAIRRLVAGRFLPEPDFRKVTVWTDKIISLLNHHQIQLIDPDWMFWVLMQGNDNGRVHGTLMNRIGRSGEAEPLLQP